ncbi:MAG: cell division protein FtsL [Gammaproteobacteria bacterium]|nr:cell division protein FtsL [Gammaproteobacteria bacterium]
MKRPTRSGFWMVLGIAAWAGIAVAGIETARQSGEMRDLFQRLSTNQEVQDGLLAEYRLLLLEQATLASYLNLESVATDDLDMRFPERIRRVER